MDEIYGWMERNIGGQRIIGGWREISVHGKKNRWGERNVGWRREIWAGREIWMGGEKYRWME